MTISTTTLKNAARAIECDLWIDQDGANYLAKDGAILERWEPATNDADAFRLMVARRLDVNYYPGFGEVRASDENGDHEGVVAYTGNTGSDTRAAIVLCAAAIGAGIKKTGCGYSLIGGQYFTYCGETDMGQSKPALCTNCGGSFKR